jgi:hypothetical protein
LSVGRGDAGIAIGNITGQAGLDDHRGGGITEIGAEPAIETVHVVSERVQHARTASEVALLAFTVQTHVLPIGTARAGVGVEAGQAVQTAGQAGTRRQVVAHLAGSAPSVDAVQAVGLAGQAQAVVVVGPGHASLAVRGVGVVDAVGRSSRALSLRAGREAGEAEGAVSLTGALHAEGRARQALVPLQEIVNLADAAGLVHGDGVDRTVVAVRDKITAGGAQTREESVPRGADRALRRCHALDAVRLQAGDALAGPEDRRDVEIEDALGAGAGAGTDRAPLNADQAHVLSGIEEHARVRTVLAVIRASAATAGQGAGRTGTAGRVEEESRRAIRTGSHRGRGCYTDCAFGSTSYALILVESGSCETVGAVCGGGLAVHAGG